MYICSTCGYGSSSWMGRCPDCGEWNTFVKQDTGDGKKSKKKKQGFGSVAFREIKSDQKNRTPTSLGELNRVLGGGFIPGEVVLVTGEPGVGKSTLLLQALSEIRTLYISGEESGEQVRHRAERLGIDLDKLTFSETLQIESIRDGIEDNKGEIDVVVVDSIQTVYSMAVDSPYGSISQLKESSSQLIQAAKSSNIPIIVVGHVTKDGDVAGPKTLEHMVDAVLTFEGERISQYRILRAKKNRFGSTDEIGIFEMQEKGLQEITNPLAFFEDSIHEDIPGKAIVGVMEGSRGLFLEIQVLVSPTVLPMPRRVVKGVDYNKVLLLLAVAQKQLRMQFDKFDIYINVVGGVNTKSPAADLGVVAALISSVKNIPLSSKNLFIGEVGLLGEVRKVVSQERIEKEGKRLGFTNIYSSSNSKKVTDLQRAILARG